MFSKLIQNHILANLTFVLVLFMGWVSYQGLPREQDPSVNFNWVQVWTVWQGASATDIEARVTEVLEKSIDNVADVKFISSSSREGVSSILVRFDELDASEFDQRMTDLRREIQSKSDQLPAEAELPDVLEISSSNAFPTAVVVVMGVVGDEELRKTAYNTKQQLRKINGVDRVDTVGALDRELQVLFEPERLLGMGVSPVGLVNTVKAYFRDLAAGSLSFGEQKWLVRLEGTSSDPAYLEQLPILSLGGEVPLRSVAQVQKGHADARELVLYNGSPAVMLSIFKKDKANNLHLLKQVNNYIASRNQFVDQTGIKLVLVDDQTSSTRQAIELMERNAGIGFGLVLIMAWLFLGARMAFFASIGIPFVLAGVFWMLALTGQTLNVTVLLAVVISLGMLVDDAVVVVEAIYCRLQRGMPALDASIEGLKEVVAPVTAAVLTTIAAFLPLMLLPGVLGEFMRVVPIVVSMALVLSLIEVYWMLPGHIIESKIDLTRPSRSQRLRERMLRRLRRYYIRALIRVLRHPRRSFSALSILIVFTSAALYSGFVKVDFFAGDAYRLFYINVEMPPATNLKATMKTLEEIEHKVRLEFEPGELRAMVAYSGLRFTEKEPLIGEEKGQIFITLNASATGLRTVAELIDSLRDVVSSVPGPLHTSFLQRKTGPPTSKPISIKVRGDNVDEIRRAVAKITGILGSLDGIRDLSDDDTKGRQELVLRLNPDAITRAGLNPADVSRIVRLFVGGEIAASMQHEGEKLNVRVRARPESLQDVEAFLEYSIGLSDGGEVPLGALVNSQTQEASSNIKHYNLRRSITIEADLNPEVMDAIRANQYVRKQWKQLAPSLPNIDLDFSGEMDDILDSLQSLAVLFLLALGLIYMILGAQFRSYIQPLLILGTVPMAFIGVVLGLIVSGNPLSLFTLYGVVALAGIAANDAIVLVNTANRQLKEGRPLAVAVLLAAKRRVIPIIITTLTTIAGLFSLAFGLGGESLVWGSVATAIVWGLGFSSLLTLFIIPLLYGIFTPQGAFSTLALPLPFPLSETPQSKLVQIFRLIFVKNKVEFPVARSIVLNQILRTRFNEGCKALSKDDYDSAIRIFEKLVEDNPQVPGFAMAAAQASIMWMTTNEWDVGYDARARRYIRHVEELNDEYRHLAVLKRAIKSLSDAEDQLKAKNYKDAIQ